MRFKKLVSILLVILMISTISIGCAQKVDDPNSPADSGKNETSSVNDSKEPGDKLTVGFSIVSLTFPYYVSMLQGFEEASKEKGWDYIYTDAGLDVEKTINDCLDLISKDIDALVIASWYGESLLEVFEAAEVANIPVFMIDTGGLPEDGNYVTNIGTDNFQAGYNGGYWAAKHFLEQDKSEVNLVSFTTSTTVGRDRADGFLEGLKEGGLEVNKLNEYLDESREGYMASCEDALVTYPNIDLIFSANGLGGLGSYDAVSAAGRSEIEIIGFDCEEEEIELIDQGTQYIGSIMQLPKEMAAQTIQNIEDYLFNEVEFDKSTPFTSGIYTAEGALTAEDILGQ